MVESGFDETRMPRQGVDLVHIGGERQPKESGARCADTSVISWNGSGLDRFLLHSVDPTRRGMGGCCRAYQVTFQSRGPVACRSRIVSVSPPLQSGFGFGMIAQTKSASSLAPDNNDFSATYLTSLKALWRWMNCANPIRSGFSAPNPDPAVRDRSRLQDSR